MATRQSGDVLASQVAVMSKSQLYDLMSQMKVLIEQNQDKARQILIDNPALTRSLFQAQIMLGMVQPPKVMPNIQQVISQPEPSKPMETETEPAPVPSRPPSFNLPPKNYLPPPPPLPSNPPPQLSAPPSQLASQQFNMQSHFVSQLPPPPLPPHQPRMQVPSFSNQMAPQQQMMMTNNNSMGFQGGPQQQQIMPQPMFHPSGMAQSSFSQVPPPLPSQPPPQQLYQVQSDRPGPWTTSTQMPGPPPVMPGHQMGPPPPMPGQPRPQQLTQDMEKALLQQVMSLTQEQINMLAPDQRHQVFQLQDMLSRNQN